MLRRTGTLGLSIVLVLALGYAAHASQRIWYEGETLASRILPLGDNLADALHGHAEDRGVVDDAQVVLTERRA